MEAAAKACVTEFCVLHLSEAEARYQACAQLSAISMEMCYHANGQQGVAYQNLWRIGNKKREIPPARLDLEFAVGRLRIALESYLDQGSPRTQAQAQLDRLSREFFEDRLDNTSNPAQPLNNSSGSQPPSNKDLQDDARFEWQSLVDLSPKLLPKDPSTATNDPSNAD